MMSVKITDNTRENMSPNLRQITKLVNRKAASCFLLFLFCFSCFHFFNSLLTY